MSLQKFSSLLLKNGGKERNMCCLNSILQLLRHIPEFLIELEHWEKASPLLHELNIIPSCCGSSQPSSASRLRQLLAEATGRRLNSGNQHDTVELLGYLLNHCPSELFHFETISEYRFNVNGQPSSCPICHGIPDSIPGSDSLLRLALPQTWSNTKSALTLQTLLDRHFRVLLQPERSCSTCKTKFPFMEKLKLSKKPEYLIIQLLRMEFANNQTKKMPSLSIFRIG